MIVNEIENKLEYLNKPVFNIDTIIYKNFIQGGTNYIFISRDIYAN